MTTVPGDRFRLTKQLSPTVFQGVDTADGIEVFIVDSRVETGESKAEERVKSLTAAAKGGLIVCKDISAIETPNSDSFLIRVVTAVTGTTLGAIMARGPLRPPVSFALAKALLSSLSALHELGPGHGSLRPDTILVTGSEMEGFVVQFAPFSIYPYMLESDFYSAPEVILLGAPLDEQAADIWSAACLIAELFGLGMRFGRRVSLFGGIDPADRLKTMTRLLGVPEAAEFSYLTPEQAAHLVGASVAGCHSETTLQALIDQVAAPPWLGVFLRNALVFDPRNRPTVGALLDLLHSDSEMRGLTTLFNGDFPVSTPTTLPTGPAVTPIATSVGSKTSPATVVMGSISPLSSQFQSRVGSNAGGGWSGSRSHQVPSSLGISGARRQLYSLSPQQVPPVSTTTALPVTTTAHSMSGLGRTGGSSTVSLDVSPIYPRMEILVPGVYSCSVTVTFKDELVAANPSLQFMVSEDGSASTLSCSFGIETDKIFNCVLQVCVLDFSIRVELFLLKYYNGTIDGWFTLQNAHGKVAADCHLVVRCPIGTV